ncbi:serine hydrolase domain-containing protein [Streptosporangium sp. NPDC023825]|uniref:serine hydrolase domain-containing protein n=1 Tax=Streptosporangium sp. NPDC023825 TaxID=3154909 RepID=UPI00342C029B
MTDFRTARRLSCPEVFGEPGGVLSRMLSCIALTVGLTLLVAPPVTAQDGPVDTVAIDRYVTAYLNRNGIPGAAVAVVSRKGVVHVAGYGRGSDGADVTGDTAFPVASVSKSFTAVAVLRLVEQGTVRLDDPVVTYLPEFAMADPRARQITVRNLLDQTSGLDDRRAPADPAESLRRRVSQLADAGLLFAPGERFRYDNLNSEVAARLVEVVSGRPFASFMAEEVFGPLGMRASTTVDTAARFPRSGHVRVFGTAVPAPAPAAFVNGSQGVVTTAADMARWLSAHLNQGVGPDGGRVLSAESIHVAHTPTARSPEYVMGWIADDPGELSHSGGNATFMAEQTLLLRDGYGIAVMVDVGMTATAADADAIVDGLVTILGGGSAAAGVPVSLVTDVVFGVLTLIVVVLGTRGVRRARRWAAARRRMGTAAVRLLPYLVPGAVSVTLPVLATALYTRRTGWDALAYGVPAVLMWLGVSTVVALAVVTVRVRALVASRSVPVSSSRARDATIVGSGSHAE